jgi:hypothetical protein
MGLCVGAQGHVKKVRQHLHRFPCGAHSVRVLSTVNNCDMSTVCLRADQVGLWDAILPRPSAGGKRSTSSDA